MPVADRVAPIVHTLPNARGVESLCIVLRGTNGVYSAAVFGAFARDWELAQSAANILSRKA
jgi:hypothetical protein